MRVANRLDSMPSTSLMFTAPSATALGRLGGRYASHEVSMPEVVTAAHVQSAEGGPVGHHLWFCVMSETASCWVGVTGRRKARGEGIIARAGSQFCGLSFGAETRTQSEVM
jgi:hypothetical protein